jgi:hypothetical protein
MAAASFRCRAGCGACCIAPSITTPFVGMPHGKRAGERCVHLDANNLCALFGHPDRPAFCAAIAAEPAMCGDSAAAAMAILAAWEQATRPNPGVTAPVDAGKAPSPR